MPLFENLFASHAKKGYKRGVRKNGPRPYFKNGVPKVDLTNPSPYRLRRAEKYSGGKGSHKRRTHVNNGVRTKNEFIDKRANRANVPIYVKITHQGRSNPKSTAWRQIAEPEKIVVSADVADSMLSQKNIASIEAAGNYAKATVDPNFATRRYLFILDGDRLEQETYEFRTADDPEIYNF